MVGLLGLDADRLVLWLFARCVQESPDEPSLEEVARQVARVGATARTVAAPATV